MKSKLTQKLNNDGSLAIFFERKTSKSERKFGKFVVDVVNIKYDKNGKLKVITNRTFSD